MHLLTCLSMTDVLDEIGEKCDAKWRRFGTFLRFESSLMDSIENNNSNNVTDCMLDLVTKWVNKYEGSGDLPRTWQTVVEVVSKSGWGKLAEELAKKYRVNLT